MIAKDIMTKDIITVSPKMTIRKLALTLIKNQISGAPVAEKSGKIVGIVSEADIVAKKGRERQSDHEQKGFQGRGRHVGRRNRPTHDDA